jgi:hypothetical protein
MTDSECFLRLTAIDEFYPVDQSASCSILWIDCGDCFHCIVHPMTTTVLIVSDSNSMHVKRRKRHGQPRPPPAEAEDVAVMQVSKNWGRDRSRYFEDGDSGTSSDEEHYVETAIAEERKHLSALREDSFKAFGNIRRLQKPLDRPDDIDAVEQSIEETELTELRTAVTQTIRDVTDASRDLQIIADPARRQLLLSLVTNGCFYLHLIGSGFKSGRHPALSHIQEIKRLLGPPAPEEEEQHAEEEEEAAPEAHVPVQLRTVRDGAWRPVSRTIATGKVLPPNQPGMRKNPRMRGRVKYRRMKAVHDARVRRRSDTGSGFYHGQFAGINPDQRHGVKLHPAH